MDNVFTNLKNCYGIPAFNYTFQFDEEKKAYLIYAPNGIMKTSFANTLNDIILEQETKDYFYPDRDTERVVKYNNEQGNDLSKDEILVIEPYCENYKSENITVLLADKKLKKEYEEIHAEINKKMESVCKNINSLSGKRESQLILVKDFEFNEKDMYDCFEKIWLKYKDQDINDFSNIKYGNLINSDTESVFKDDDFINQIGTYIAEYEKLLTSSKVFKKAFNHNNAEDVIKVLNKDGFFAAKHKVVLDNSETAIGENEFKQIISDEKKRILDSEMAAEFKKIDDLLKAKTGTKALREFILNNKEIIPELLDIEKFKKKLWISYLFSERSTFEEAVLNYQNNKKKLLMIITAAKSQRAKWNDIVKHFNERFSNMPFVLEIVNKEDVVLKSETPTIKFQYKDRGETVPVDQSVLISHLSNGEKKALYLLNVIFEIEARKEIGKDTLIVMDDIADSFDYRNKYAIIEYIKGIIECEYFMPIILTHNFDFYRTVASRTSIKNSAFFVNKDDESIALVQGQYFNNVFSSWRNRIFKNDVIFLSSIAFIRNIVEYTKGDKDKTYINLTNLLHYKKEAADDAMATDNIKIQDLINWYQNEWGVDSSKFEQDVTKRIVDLLNSVADKIVVEQSDSIFIENKIVLSIAIRQKAERYMVERINDDAKVRTITRNQTRELKNLIAFEDTESDKNIQDILERVLIITSENIHINSFMYEPIVDMSLKELICLYSEVKSLQNITD